MNMPASLAINFSLNAQFIPTGILALPAEVDTAAFLAVMGDELRVLINRHGQCETLQYRINHSRDIKSLPVIPMTVAAITSCHADLYISGSNSSGEAVFGKLDAEGKMIWQFALKGVSPIRWPEPVCASRPMLVWQTKTSKVEIADISQGRLNNQISHTVTEFPIEITADEQGIWVAGTDTSGIVFNRLEGQLWSTTKITTATPSELSIGRYQDTILLAWNHASSVFNCRFDTKNAMVKPIKELQMQSAGVGRPVVVPGRRPLIWIQQIDYFEDESSHWQSRFVAEDSEALIIDGLIHDVAQWGDTLAVLGSRELCLFDWAC